jgi:uncharacterized protein
VRQQVDDGYLGTYSLAFRFTSPTAKQTYDLWMNGYILQGLLEAHRLLDRPVYVAAAEKIARLCLRTYGPGGKRIVDAGPFGGMASACVLEQFVDLYEVTRVRRYLEFAEFCAGELDRRPGTEWLRRLRHGYDVAQIDSGKMYEMLRCLTGLAKLYRITGRRAYWPALRHAWREIHDHHLNAAGAPAGGVGIHHECFNVRFSFSPYWRSETCAMMEWLRFSGEMLRLTGAPQYAAAIEHVAYNALPGAQFTDGRGWTYHSILNGPRTRTGVFACCASSGTIALEELPPRFYAWRDGQLFVNLYGPSRARLGDVVIEQATEYPRAGTVRLVLRPDRPRRFTLALRVPDWAPRFLLDGQPTTGRPDRWHTITRRWTNGATVTLEFPMTDRFIERVREYNEKGEYLDGCTRYRARLRGPLLYATRWNDCEEKPKPLTNADRPFVPYFELGRNRPNTPRTVWMVVP